MKYETKELKSKRLVIKKGTINDFLKVYEYDYSKLKNAEETEQLVKQDETKLKNLFKGGIDKYYSKIQKAHMFDWIIYLNDEAIGNILTGDEDIKKKEIEITFNMHPKYWGNGYMTEALSLVIEYLYMVGYDNVICRFSDGNKRAKRVLDKLGFKAYRIISDSFQSDKGYMIDEYEVIMTKEDWLSKTGRITKIDSSL